MTSTAPAAQLPVGTRVRITGFGARSEGATGVVEAAGTGEFAGWTAVAMDRRATAEEVALLYPVGTLVALPEPTVSLVKRPVDDGIATYSCASCGAEVATIDQPAHVSDKINGRTACEWEQVAVAATESERRSYQSQHESWERSDTDGFLSQWASGSMAREYHAKAQWARNHGYTTETALALLDGTIAAVGVREGQYGPYYLVSAEAQEALGLAKPFVTTSKARDYRKAKVANAKKGVKLVRVSVPGSAPKLRGSNALALSVYSEPEWDRVRAGEVETVDADWMETLAERADERARKDAERDTKGDQMS